MYQNEFGHDCVLKVFVKKKRKHAVEYKSHESVLDERKYAKMGKRDMKKNHGILSLNGHLRK